MQATVLGLEFRGLEKIIYHASGFRRSFGALLCRLGVSVLQGLFCICYLPTAKGQALADECGIKFIAGVCNKSKCGASSLFLIRCSYTLKRRRTPIYNEFRNQNLGAINSVRSVAYWKELYMVVNFLSFRKHNFTTNMH